MAIKQFNVLLSLIMISIVIEHTLSQLCQNQIQYSNTSSTSNCIFHYTYNCNYGSSFSSFQYCSYNLCSSNMTNPCELVINSNSSDVENCRNSCSASLDESSSPTWFQILLIILSIVFIMALCVCIVRKCRSQPSPLQIRRPWQEVYTAGTHRRLNYHNNQSQSKWDDADSNWRSSQQICIICLDNQINASLHCLHLYHFNCIRQWLRIRQFCPTCKTDNLLEIKILCKRCRLRQTIYPFQQLDHVDTVDICPNCNNTE